MYNIMLCAVRMWRVPNNSVHNKANSLGLFTKSSDVTATKISEWNNYEKPQLQTKLIAYIDN